MDFQSLDRAVESGSFHPKLCTPPRLPVYSLQAKKPDPLGMTTPPVGPQGAIPFQWEQAPGKPKNSEALKHEPKRRNHSTSASATNTRLGLPPKMAAAPRPAAKKEKRFSKPPGSHAFSASSMRDALRQRSASLTSLSSLVKGRRNSSSSSSSSSSFCSSISNSFVKGRQSFAKDDSSFAKEGKEWIREDKGEDIISPCYSASSSHSSSSLTSPFSSACTGGEEESEEEETKEVAAPKVRITRYERERTLTCHTASDFWSKISGRLQAAAPWRRDSKM